MLLDLDLVIEIDPAELPVRILIRCWRLRCWRQRPERGLTESLVERTPCLPSPCHSIRLRRTEPLASFAPAAHGPIIELIGQFSDRLVQFDQGEEPLVAQPGEDPSLHDLVPGLVRTRRY